MATSIRATLVQRPGQEGLEISFSAEAIVDDPENAEAQGREVYRLIEAFETGLQAEAGH